MSAKPISPNYTAQRLSKLREQLVDLKDDRTTYIKSADVLTYYDELTELVKAFEQQFGDAAQALATGDMPQKSPIQRESPSPSIAPLHAVVDHAQPNTSWKTASV